MDNKETMTHNTVTVYESPATSGYIQHSQTSALVKRSLFDLEPEDQIIYASKIATSLTVVIEKQQLFSIISGRKYVKVEGWELLGTFLGILPRERSITEHLDGSFEAAFDLVRQSDGTVVGGASALCGMDEKRWGSADRYARRSMAATRAVGKAYRTSFSWIISLAGYCPTPEEEMPKDAIDIPFEPTPTKKVAGIYTGESSQQEKITQVLKKQMIDESLWPDVHEKLMGKPSSELSKIIAEIKADNVKF